MSVYLPFIFIELSNTGIPRINVAAKYGDAPNHVGYTIPKARSLNPIVVQIAFFMSCPLAIFAPPVKKQE